ncbi:MAG: hypothetical protein NTW19_10190 [Planctomycetota bacterium]|nr:hypothetical protein [Planctomycetota bacterium]
MSRDSRGFFEAMVGDGRPLISLTGLCLGLAGGFVCFQAGTGHFLPHDTAYLRMTAEDLCRINECRVVHFMIHDRVSFGGALVAIAALYLWLAEFPLRAGAAWAWWTLALSGVAGFGSFLTYLGYGYLDTWHGLATLFLLPCFVGGLWRTRSLVRQASNGGDTSWRALLAPSAPLGWRSREGLGRACLLASAVGAVGAGFTIQAIGMTSVFVQTDLAFMGLTREEVGAINPRLVPLIAHDRAGFGGAVATIGIMTAAIVWCAVPSRSLRQALLVAGLAAWASAIGVHPAIGYVSPLHLAPAVTGAAAYFLGLGLLDWRAPRDEAREAAAPIAK